MSDQHEAGLAPWTDGMRRMRELATQMATAAQALAVAGAKATPSAWSQPLARYTEQLLAVSAAVTTPLRELLDEQERLVTMMAEWAEEHRLMSARVAEWAAEQRRLSEQMADLAQPFLDQSVLLERLHTEWRNRAEEG